MLQRTKPPYLDTMYCSFSNSFPLVLLLLILPLSSSVPSVSNSNAHHSTNTINMVPSEAETLFTIMESMSSDQTWRVSFPQPCQPGSTWPGIECKLGTDSHLHVSRLDFGNHPYPSCKRTATFPSQISALPHLQSVFFFNCFTHTKTSFSVSRDSNASSLQQLSLRSNLALVGPIPPQISFLKSLEILTLSQNRLTGKIPLEIFSLSSLVHLDLSYNMLTGSIPVQLGSLRNLQGLDLSYNMLTGSIPNTIGELGLLQKVDFSSNLLTGGIPDGIEKLTLLNFLALSNNKLHGPFPKGLEKLQSLQYIILDANPMNTTLPLDLGKLVKLQELRLADSGYSGTIPESFSQLKNLSTLSLQNNRLTGEIPLSFGSLSRIYHLNLSRNMLSGVVPFNSSFLSRLGRNLDLSGNPSLCLSPSEAHSLKIGVNVCGTNSNGSAILPLKNSQASSGLSKPFFLFTPTLCVLGLYQILFLV
ncbi:hypothetical protein ACLB2K_067159 [Fragaria x ananassa]